MTGLNEAQKQELIREINRLNNESDCPLETVLSLISGKWRMRVLGEISLKSNTRFGEIKKSLPGITSTMLTSTLRELEEIGLIRREQFNEVPPHVEYHMTEAGNAIMPGLYELTKWGIQYL